MTTSIGKDLLDLCKSKKFEQFVNATNNNTLDAFFHTQSYANKIGQDGDFHYEPVQFTAYLSELLGRLDPSSSEFKLAQLQTSPTSENFLKLQKCILANMVGTSDDFKTELGDNFLDSDKITYTPTFRKLLKKTDNNTVKSVSVFVDNINVASDDNNLGIYNTRLQFKGVPFFSSVAELNIIPRILDFSTNENKEPLKNAFLYTYLLAAISDLDSKKDMVLSLITTDEQYTASFEDLFNKLTNDMKSVIPASGAKNSDTLIKESIGVGLHKSLGPIVDELKNISMGDELTRKIDSKIIDLLGAPPNGINLDAFLLKNTAADFVAFNAMIKQISPYKDSDPAVGQNPITAWDTRLNNGGPVYPLLKIDVNTSKDLLNQYYNASGGPVVVAAEGPDSGGANFVKKTQKGGNAAGGYTKLIEIAENTSKINMKTDNDDSTIDKLGKLFILLAIINTIVTQWGTAASDLAPAGEKIQMKKVNPNTAITLNADCSAGVNAHMTTALETILKTQIKETFKNLMKNIVPRILYIKKIFADENNLQINNKIVKTFYNLTLQALLKRTPTSPASFKITPGPKLSEIEDWFLCMQQNPNYKTFFNKFFNVVKIATPSDVIRIDTLVNNIGKPIGNRTDWENYRINMLKTGYQIGGFDILHDLIGGVRKGGALPTVIIFSNLPSINPNNFIWITKDFKINADKLKSVTDPKLALQYITRKFFEKSAEAVATGRPQPTIELIPGTPELTINRDTMLFLKYPATILTVPFTISTEALFAELEKEIFGERGKKKEPHYNTEKFLEELIKVSTAENTEWKRDRNRFVKYNKGTNVPAVITSNIEQQCQFLDNTVCVTFLNKCIAGKKRIDDTECQNIILTQNNIFNLKDNNNEYLKVGEIVKYAHKLNPAYAAKILHFFNFGTKKSTARIGKTEVSIDKVESGGSWLRYINKNPKIVGGSDVVDKITKNKDLLLYLEILVNYVNAHPKVLNPEYTGELQKIDTDDVLEIDKKEWKIYKYKTYKYGTANPLTELERLKNSLLNDVTGPSSTYMLGKSVNMAKDWALNPVMLNPLPYGIPLSIKQKGGGLYDGLIDITIRREPGRYSNDSFEEKLKKGFNDQDNNYGAAMLKDLVNYAQELLSRGEKFKMSESTYKELIRKVEKLGKIEDKITNTLGNLVIKRRVYNKSRGLINLNEIEDKEYLDKLLKKHEKFAKLSDAYRKKSVDLITVLQHLYKIIEEKVGNPKTEREEVDYPNY
jgi:hypothetical protein